MQLLIFSLAFVVSTLALPSPETPSVLIARFTESDECQLPQAPQACSGSPQKDVIVHYGKSTTKEQKDLLLNAAKAAGATVHGVIDSFGFTAFIPESVVALMSAHGQTCGVKIYDNGCAGIPWCGEAPC